MFTLLQNHWFELIQTVAIVAGLLYTARSFSLDTRSRKAEFVFRVSKAHREIWESVIDDPELARVLEKHPDLSAQPITRAEERLVLLVIHHLSAVHEAISLDLYPTWPGIDEDVRQFFSLPIPSALLPQYLPAQRQEFRSYLTRILKQ